MESAFNIIEEHLIDVSENDFESNRPFFFHTTVGGTIVYQPWGNKSSDALITKVIEASDDFNRITQCRKIVSSGTTATSIYIGYPR